MSYPFCKEWGVDADEFIGLCSQQFKPKTGTDECPVCVTPGLPTGTCSQQESGNCVGVRFPYRVSFEIPTLTEPFSNGEFSDTTSQSYSSGGYSWTYSSTIHWKSVSASSISQMNSLTVPGYDPEAGSDQGSACYWENVERLTQHLRIDLTNYNVLGPVGSTDCPCPPATKCYTARYHTEEIQKQSTLFGSVSPFTDCGQPATYTTPCNPTAKIICRPSATTSGLVGEYYAKWTLELSHSSYTGKTTARLFLRRKFTSYMERNGSGHPWYYIGDPVRIPGSYKVFSFPGTSSFFFAKAPTKYSILQTYYSVDGYPMAAGTPAKPGVPAGSLKYGAWIGDAIGVWTAEDVCRTSKFGTWKMSRTYQTYDEYPQYAISNLPSNITVRINAG